MEEMMKRILISFLCSLSFLFADLNPGYLPKGTEIVSLRTANARHYSNGDGTIRAVILAREPSAGENEDAIDTLVSGYTGYSELMYAFGSLYTAVKHYHDYIYCGYYGEYYPDAYILERGWVEWDISSIPNFAVINNLTLRHYCSSITGTVYKVQFYQMTNRPSTVPPTQSGAVLLYNDAGDGNFYGKDTPPGNGWRTITLNSSARTDFQNRLNDDWFAIGYCGYGPGTYNTWEIEFHGDTHSYPPRLIVDYSLPYDVGVTKIISPTGTIDSVAEIAPACSVYNFGTNTVSYLVRMKIGSFYDETTSVENHTPGSLRYVSFPNYSSWPRGTHSLSCSTQLTTDMNRANDKKTGTFSVRVRDVGVVSIVLPQEVDSGTSLTPACTVYNFGTTTEGPYFVRMKIGDFYNQTANVNSHNPGDKVSLTFPSFSNWPRGNHSVSCSTELSSDFNPTNDKVNSSLMVHVSDVGVTKIIAPTGIVDSGDSIIPASSVYNYGNREENYSVRMRIGSFYNQTASVSGHSPGTSLYLTFPGWTAQEVGTFPVSCSTELGRDLRGENDKKTDSVIVRRQVKDVGVDSIIRPYVYESQGPLRPKALVKNYGETEESCWVYFRINIHLGALVYSDSQFISLLPDSTKEVEFREWQATGPLLYLARCSTALEGDVQPENDKKERIFLVEALVSDVGVLEIKRPRGEISPGPIRPEARIYNYGRYPESDFAYFRIISEEGEVYYDSSYVSELYPGSYQDVLFDEWNAEIGNYTAECSTALSTDQNHLNDKMSVSFRVRIPSAGWILVGNVPLSPDNKKIKSGGGMTECGGNIYILKGNNTRSLYRYLPNSSSAVFEDSVPIGSGKKVKKGSGIVSDGERYIYIFKGSNTKEFFRYDTRRETTWKELAPVLGDKGLKGGTGVCYLSGFIYLLKGSNTTEFYRYHTGENRWEQLQSPPRNKGFKDGSSLVAFNDKVYLLGDNYNNFYRYSPDANSWDTLKPLPLYHPQVRKKKKVKEGAAMAVKDGKIFAFKGGNTGEFWVYNPEEDSWSGLDTIPKFPDGKRVKGGGSLIALGEEIWALKGNNTTSIWKYIGEKMPFSTFSINKETMDLIRNDWKNSLRITPNPTKGLTTVCSKDKGKIMTLRVYNTLGELVYWAKSNKGIFTVKKLPKGVYLVRISAPGDEKKEKLVILK